MTEQKTDGLTDMIDRLRVESDVEFGANLLAVADFLHTRGEIDNDRCATISAMIGVGAHASAALRTIPAGWKVVHVGQGSSKQSGRRWGAKLKRIGAQQISYAPPVYISMAAALVVAGLWARIEEAKAAAPPEAEAA